MRGRNLSAVAKSVGRGAAQAARGAGAAHRPRFFQGTLRLSLPRRPACVPGGAREQDPGRSTQLEAPQDRRGRAVADNGLLCCPGGQHRHCDG